MSDLNLESLIRAHPYIGIEHPPRLWQVQADDVPFVRLFGELIAASLVRNGGILHAVFINISNVVIEPEAAGPMPAGEFVAVTARGPGDWGPEIARVPATGARPSIVSADVEKAASEAGVAWMYSRTQGASGGSVTALFRRRLDPAPR